MVGVKCLQEAQVVINEWNTLKKKKNTHLKREAAIQSNPIVIMQLCKCKIVRSYYFSKENPDFYVEIYHYLISVIYRFFKILCKLNIHTQDKIKISLQIL